jgi:poly-beta-1,6-N-acetyl-D-glucosamine synthase
MNERYVIISPCRDEANYMRRTLDTVAAQTVKPALWVVVDDGSTDGTPQILQAYASRLPYLRIVTRPDRGVRKLGGGVIDAFYAGLEQVELQQFGFLCKLDLDLELPPRYFQCLLEHMRLQPRLGTCSGKPYFRSSAGKLISEKCGDENSVGMTKFYRTQCFHEIGGFVHELMWDGIDGHRCRQLGWIAQSLDEPELRFIHLRPMGTSHKNWWTGRVRHGVGQWYMGTGFPYMLASACYRMMHPPRIVGGMAMIWGWLRSMIQRKPRHGDPGFRQFLRRYQLRCMLHGKRSATAELNQRQAVVWAARHIPQGEQEQTVAAVAQPLKAKGSQHAVAGDS